MLGRGGANYSRGGGGNSVGDYWQDDRHGRGEGHGRSGGYTHGGHPRGDYFRGGGAYAHTAARNLQGGGGTVHSKYQERRSAEPLASAGGVSTSMRPSASSQSQGGGEGGSPRNGLMLRSRSVAGLAAKGGMVEG